MKPKKRTTKKSLGKELAFEFLSQSQLSNLSGNEHVFVDSSAICAIIQEYMFSGEKLSNRFVRRLEARMFSESIKGRDAILFGQYVEMSIFEVGNLFGGLKEIPSGIIKRDKGTTPKITNG